MIAEPDRSLVKRLVGISSGNACDALTVHPGRCKSNTNPMHVNASA